MSSPASDGNVTEQLTAFRAAIAMCVALLVAGCGSAQSASPPRRSVSPLVRLPADQANHPKVANEWWYVVGHVRSGTHTFGYETTIFRFSHVTPPGFTTPVTLYRTDVAITDETGKRFHQLVTYHFPQDANLSHVALNESVGLDSLAGTSTKDMVLRSTLAGGAIHLRLSSRRRPMYVGGRGYIPFGNGFTYYYSLTDLATSGSLTVNGTKYRVTGVSWLDHQWGNWSWRTIRGWTWMALQLNNGVQLSVFDFRGTRTRVRAASVLLANGRLRTIPTASIMALGRWVSPHTGGRYPSGWIVRIAPLAATLRVEPTVKDQELVFPGVKLGSYWEGSGRVTGTFGGAPVTGLSYTELTGYAGGFPNG